VFTCTANKQIYSVDITIKTPFNGTSPSLSIGDAADHNRIMSTTENNPAEAANYLVVPDYIYTADTPVLLYIVQGAGATAGTGIVTIEIQE